jgi:hypothetical protein
VETDSEPQKRHSQHPKYPSIISHDLDLPVYLPCNYSNHQSRCTPGHGTIESKCTPTCSISK